MPIGFFEKNFLKTVIGAVCVAAIFMAVDAAHQGGTSWDFWVAPVLLSGFLFGVINGFSPGILRSVVNGGICAIGSWLWVIQFSSQGEASHPGYLLFSVVGLWFMPLTGIWFNFVSAIGNMLVSTGKSFASTSIEFPAFKARLMGGLFSGLISILVSMILASSQLFFWGERVALLLEGMFLGGLLVLRNIVRR